MGEFIECPSGLSGEIRGLVGKEARILGDRALVKSGQFFDKILEACWLNTVDPGPYEMGQDNKPDWSKVLLGDRFFVMMRIRAKMFGNEYPVRLQCTSADCRSTFNHVIRLDELEVKTLDPVDKENFQNGNRLEGQLPDGRKFVFRLAVGADEARAARGKTDSFVEAMLPLIYEIEDVCTHSDDPQEMAANMRAKRAYFDDGELGLSFAALSAMDEHNCGVSTTITVDCPNCYTTMDQEIPFGQGFLAPITKLKR